MEEEVFKKNKTLIIFNIYKYEFCMNHLKSQINSSFFVDSMKGGKNYHHTGSMKCLSCFSLCFDDGDGVSYPLYQANPPPPLPEGGAELISGDSERLVAVLFSNFVYVNVYVYIVSCVLITKFISLGSLCM